MGDFVVLLDQADPSAGLVDLQVDGGVLGLGVHSDPVASSSGFGGEATDQFQRPGDGCLRDFQPGWVLFEGGEHEVRVGGDATGVESDPVPVRLVRVVVVGQADDQVAGGAAGVLEVESGGYEAVLFGGVDDAPIPGTFLGIGTLHTHGSALGLEAFDELSGLLDRHGGGGRRRAVHLAGVVGP
ncbi:hypothetical protein [Verrucosispora sp. TAA-831]|uniref:hypothetical protein n=1 Tax=Verrucosispora sp. TAA-831 TaxID=3422227 RepID=UPI003D6DAFE0